MVKFMVVAEIVSTALTAGALAWVLGDVGAMLRRLTGMLVAADDSARSAARAAGDARLMAARSFDALDDATARLERDLVHTTEVASHLATMANAMGRAAAAMVTAAEEMVATSVTVSAAGRQSVAEMDRRISTLVSQAERAVDGVTDAAAVVTRSGDYPTISGPGTPPAGEAR